MSQTLPPVMNTIEEMIADIPGWMPADQLFALYMLTCASNHLPGDIVEVGSWCGRSAAVLGLALRHCQQGRAKLHAIDLFPEKDDWRQNEDGTYSFQLEISGETYSGYHEQTVYKEPFEKDIRPVYEKYQGVEQAFNDTIQRNELTDIVRPFKGDLKAFSQSWCDDFHIRLAFIDGDHSYQAVANDIKLIETKLVSGGWICFDDAFSFYEGVNQAITEHVINNNRFINCQQLTRKLFVAQFC